VVRSDQNVENFHEGGLLLYVQVPSPVAPPIRARMRSLSRRKVPRFDRLCMWWRQAGQMGGDLAYIMWWSHGGRVSCAVDGVDVVGAYGGRVSCGGRMVVDAYSDVPYVPLFTFLLFL
jgi:hypothetical protein